MGSVASGNNLKTGLNIKMNMPQKVRHYLGHFLWKEKQSMTMHLNCHYL